MSVTYGMGDGHLSVPGGRKNRGNLEKEYIKGGTIGYAAVTKKVALLRARREGQLAGQNDGGRGGGTKPGPPVGKYTHGQEAYGLGTSRSRDKAAKVGERTLVPQIRKYVGETDAVEPRSGPRTHQRVGNAPRELKVRQENREKVSPKEEKSQNKGGKRRYNFRVSVGESGRWAEVKEILNPGTKTRKASRCARLCGIAEKNERDPGP